MELNITKDTTLWELKGQFAKHFPNLKLELYDQRNKCTQRFTFTTHIGDLVQLGLLKRLQNEGALTYDQTTTVADFEKQMQKQFGLPVKVFRRDGGVWTETKQTSNWSLRKQDAMGSATNRCYSFNVNSLFL